MLDDADGTTPTELRRALNRKALADARHRAAFGRMLAMTETDVLAIQHLSRAGQLTTSALGAQLGLTSGGTTALVQRLERAGWLERAPHPSDRRSTLLRLSAAIAREAGEVMEPLTADIDAIAARMTPEERRSIADFLTRVAEASERHADALVRSAEDRRADDVASAVPGLWA